MENKKTIPVTVLTGFLGSGKTTLLNKILSENHGKKIAVIENEFGEIGIDNELVIGADEEIFEMNNGCICCTVRGDLIRILEQLMQRKDKLDYVIVETTGMANPAPVAQTFWVDEDIKETFRLDSIVTMIDAKHVWQHIDDSSECKEQIAFADVILINKIDLVSEVELDKLESRIKSMNSQAKLYRSKEANIDLNYILNVNAFDLDTKAELNPNFVIEEVPFEWCGIFDFENKEYELNMDEGPDPTLDITYVALKENSEFEFDKAKKTAIKIFSETHKEIKPEKFLNANHTLNRLTVENRKQTYYFKPNKNGVYAVFTQHGPDEFNMVFKHKEKEIKPINTFEYAHSHEHDELVSSVGIEDDSPLSIQKVNEWLSYLLQNKGTDIFRMKGIMHIEGNDERFVFQGVHMLFDGKVDRKWKSDEKRKNQIIFIGKNLNREELINGYKSCISKTKLNFI